jgi:hypothetical protein
MGRNLGEGIALQGLGMVALASGDPDGACTYLEAAIACGRELRIGWLVASGLEGLGQAELQRGEIVRAQAVYKEAMGLRGLRGTRLGNLGILVGLAAVAVRQGRPALAARLCPVVAPLFGTAPPSSYITHLATKRRLYEQVLGEARDALGEQRFSQEWAAGQRLSLEQAIALVGDLDPVGTTGPSP